MSNEKLTIAIPTYNRKDFLKECLDSIKNQTFHDYKVIVFDNFSDYDVSALVKKYGDKFELIRNLENIGNEKNFAKIFSYEFQSEYLMVLHDDDTVYPNYIKDAILKLETNNNLVWVGGAAHFIKDRSKMSKFKSIKFNWILCDKKRFLKYIFEDYDIAFDSIIYKSRFIKSISECQQNYGKWSDRPYIISLIEDKKIMITKNYAINYRIHANQDSQQKDLEFFKKWLNFFKFYENKSLGDKSTYKYFRKWAMFSIILSFKSFSLNRKSYISMLLNKDYRKYLSLRYITFRSLFYFFKNIISF